MLAIWIFIFLPAPSLIGLLVWTTSPSCKSFEFEFSIKAQPLSLHLLVFPVSLLELWYLLWIHNAHRNKNKPYSIICCFASLLGSILNESLTELGVCWPGSVHGWAGSVWGHCALSPPLPSCSPPRREVGLPGTRPVLWMCHPAWMTGALPPVAEDCRSDRRTGEDWSERRRCEERSGTGVSLHFSLTWRSDGCSK